MKKLSFILLLIAAILICYPTVYVYHHSELTGNQVLQKYWPYLIAGFMFIIV